MDANSRLKMPRFLGRMSAPDPHDIPAGSFQEFDNLQTVNPGQITVRKGMKRMTTAATYAAIAMYRFQRPEADWIVWENSNGAVKAARVSGTSLGTPITIATGLSTFQPLCFAKGRNHVLVAVNGIDRGIRWDGLSAAAEDLGIDPPDTNAVITPSATGAYEYIYGIRFLDDDFGFVRPQQGTVMGFTLDPDDPGGQPSSLSATSSTTGLLDSGVTYTWGTLPGSSQSRVTRIQLFRSLAGEVETLYLVATLSYAGTISTVSTAAGTNKVNMVQPHGLQNGAVITISGVSGGSNINGSRTVTVVNDRAFTIGTAFSTTGTGGTWALTGFAESNSDADLELLPAMAINAPDGRHFNARRFTPPPNSKPYVVAYLDRLWYLGSIHYTAGSIATNGTTTITGTATNWPATFEGRWISIQGEATPFLVTDWVSATSMVLDHAATTTASGLYYAVSPSPVERNQIAFSEQDEPESVPETNVLPLQENTGDDDEITGVLPTGEGLVIGKDRHLVFLRAVRQPELDATPTNLTRRGLISFRCCAWFEGTSYWMDQCGIYSFNGSGEPTPIGDGIIDLWQQVTIDFSKSKWFYAIVDPMLETIRWHVAFTGDSGTRPTRWLEYDLRGNSWATGSSVEELGGACATVISGQPRVIYGGLLDVLYLANEGLADGISTAITGTATSSTNTTLVDSGKNFTSLGVLAGTPVTIVDGTGKAQTRTISVVGTTSITISAAWTTNPDTTSSYAVGGIPWTCKTGLLEFDSVGPEGERYSKRSVRLVFNPTTNAAQLDIRRYLNHGSTPANAASNIDLGTNVVSRNADPDAVVNMLSTRDSQANQAGFAEWKFGGGMAGRSQAARWFAAEFRGVQTLDAIKLYEMAFDGVK